MPHILAGVIILLHAYERYDSGHGSYVFFLVAGAAFLLIAVLHSKIERHVPWVDSVLITIEGLLSFLIAYEYFLGGKQWLPFAYAFAGIMQFVAAILLSRKSSQLHKR